MSGIKCDEFYIWGTYRVQEGVLQGTSRSNSDWKDFLGRWCLNLALEGKNYIYELYIYIFFFSTGENRANGIARSGKDANQGTEVETFCPIWRMWGIKYS